LVVGDGAENSKWDQLGRLTEAARYFYFPVDMSSDGNRCYH
jgi:hypothetical protein